MFKNIVGPTLLKFVQLLQMVRNLLNPEELFLYQTETFRTE